MRSGFKIVIDPFCYRQFKSTGSTRYDISMDMKEFEKTLNDVYREEQLRDGYAPFCKHLFVENFVDTTLYYSKITEENRHLLQTTYEARTEQELPVLKRYFKKDDLKPVHAKYLDIILYSKQQVQAENKARNSLDENEDIPYDWAVVSVKSQDIAQEIPMDPITCMRNALGKEEGGSGIPLDRTAYLKSVEFWKDHALIH